MHGNSSWARMDNQITFLLGARSPDSWLSLTSVPANESQTSTKSLKLLQENADSLTPQAQHHQITITGINGPRLAFHFFRDHGFPLLRVEPHVPLQTPGVDCCQILIERFHPMRTRKKSGSNCIDRSIFRIVYNIVPSNVKEIEGVRYKQQRP